MGRIVHSLPTCHSTNDFALELLQKEAVKSGTIVISDFQTKGKGQRGNGWESRKGLNLLFSLILRPLNLKAHQQFNLNILISNALVQTIYQIAGLKAKIKWPNDIFYKEAKLAGILIESIIQGQEIAHSVIGVGLNVNQTDFETKRATSLKLLKDIDFDLKLLLESFLENLEKAFILDDELLIQEQKRIYLENLFAFREWRQYEDAGGLFEGRVIGITELGEILIERDKGLNKYQMKEFRYIFNRTEI